MEVDQKIIDAIKSGAVGILPTDTIYGVVASVSYPASADRIYEVKKRPTDKRFVILIGNRGQLPSLGINPNSKQLEALNEFWPGPVSIDLKCDDTLKHLHLGKNSLAVRLPAETWLRRLVNETGPIIATSANLSGEATPNNIEDIEKMLPGLDFYVGGSVGSEPSRIGTLDEDGNVFWIRGS